MYKMILAYQIDSFQNIFLLSALGKESGWNLYVQHTPKMGMTGTENQPILWNYLMNYDR